jgi:hypothetical protein
MELDRNGCKVLRASMQKALDQICKDLDLDSIQIGGITFYTEMSKASMRVQVFGKRVKDDGSKVSAKKLEWAAMAPRYGLKKEDFGSEFISSGERFRIEGINTRAYKMPIKAVRVSDGRKFKFSAETVKFLLSM